MVAETAIPEIPETPEAILATVALRAPATMVGALRCNMPRVCYRNPRLSQRQPLRGMCLECDILLDILESDVLGL
jgi:hypothetical protein